MLDSNPGTLLRTARLRSGLTQRALAERAGTSQSVVARIERGRSSPSLKTLGTLLEVAGFELRAHIEPFPVAREGDGDHMLDDVTRILRLTPEQRLLELNNASRFFSAAERV